MIVLDTHVFLWMNLEQERLPNHIMNAIQTEESLGLAAISLWETAMLVQYGRVTIPDDSLTAWFRIALSALKLRVPPPHPGNRGAVRGGAGNARRPRRPLDCRYGDGTWLPSGNSR